MSFSLDSNSRDSIQAIQFELWPDCCSGCKYCYLNGTKRNTTEETKRKNILNVLDTLKDPDIMGQYNAVGLIGGDFFQGQLEGVRAEWAALMCHLNHLMEIGLIKEVWIATSLMTESVKDLMFTMQYFNFDSFREDQRVTLCVSYDTVGRFFDSDIYEEEYTQTFNKDSEPEDIDDYLMSIRSELHFEFFGLHCRNFENFFLPTNEISSDGLILPDGSLVDFNKNIFDNSKIDYNILANNDISIEKAILGGAIRFTLDTTSDNKEKIKLYFANREETFTDEQIDRIIETFKKYDNVELRTTWPAKKYNEFWVEYSKNGWRSAKYWIENIKKIKEIYPKISIHTQTILTQDTMEKMIENPNYFDFITEFSSIDFRYPSITRADCPSATKIKDYRMLLLQRYGDFPEKFFIEERSTFLKFLKVLHEKYGITKVQNLIHQPEMRSRRLKIYIDDVELEDRWNDERNVYLFCGHLVDGLCYIDTPDKCIYCDIEKYLSTVGEEK